MKAGDKKKAFDKLKADLEPLDDAGKDGVLFWAEDLWNDREFYKGLHKDRLKSGTIDWIMKWMAPAMIFMVIPFMGWAVYRGTVAVDYDRASFMLECQHMHEFSEEKCEEILKGEK